jgi:hypothetical protein
MAIINIIKLDQQPIRQIQMIQEDISDQLGGGVVVFYSSQPFLQGSLQVFLNGLNLRLNADFIEINNQTFRFINYDDNFIRTINSTNATLAIKYFIQTTIEASSLTVSAFTLEESVEPEILEAIEETVLEPEPEPEEIILFEEDLTDQVSFGSTRLYLSNDFKDGSLILISGEYTLELNIDYSESGIDSINLIKKDNIANNNLTAKYIIR